jgi:hypothetical protein
VPTLTTGPDRDPSTSPPEATKIAWGFGKQVVEGGGDAFFKKKANKETPAYRSLDHATTSTKVQSRCARVTLYRGGGSVRTNHRFGSSGLNLACEGLLLGIRSEGHEEIPDEAPPHILDLR